MIPSNVCGDEGTQITGIGDLPGVVLSPSCQWAFIVSAVAVALLERYVRRPRPATTLVGLDPT